MSQVDIDLEQNLSTENIFIMATYFLLDFGIILNATETFTYFVVSFKNQLTYPIVHMVTIKIYGKISSIHTYTMQIGYFSSNASHAGTQFFDKTVKHEDLKNRSSALNNNVIAKKPN